MKKYHEIGINRLSIGLQSSNDNLLKEIGRIHNYEQFVQTINFARMAGFNNINADAMIGLPNQTIYDIEDTLEKLINLKLNHISVYSLIVEPNTKMEKLIEEGTYKLPDEEMERYMYWYTKRKLEENGYIHYEISNFAKEGYNSKHNMDCWNQKEYIGFGAGASSYENNVRYSNTDCIEEYIKNIENNEETKNVIVEEEQDENSKMREYMILGLRKIEGVNIKEFTQTFGKSPIHIFNKELKKLVKEGLISVSLNNIKLTKKGLDLANIVWEEFI